MRSLSNFQQRFYLSLLGIGLIAIILASSHTYPFEYLFVAAISYVQAISLGEYYALAQTKNLAPLRVLGVLFSIGYTIVHYFFTGIFEPLFALVVLACISHFLKAAQAIANIAITIFGFCYITLPLSLLIDLNFFTGSSCFWIVYLIVTTKMTDTVAYFSGKGLGRHLLTPNLSPKKTYEGAIGGLVGACGASLVFFAFFPAMHSMISSWGEALLLGAAIGATAQVGDLAESLFKRDANVKDSSSLPGFGGMLDIVDSLLFTTPLLYFWLFAKGGV